MPIFSNRRLRSMLTELDDRLDSSKKKDLLQRLGHKDSSLALAAEAELSLLWALRKSVEIEIEPTLSGTSRKLEALSPDLFSHAPTVIEITAVSDDGFSGYNNMKRISEKIFHFSNSVRRKFGRYLEITFFNIDYWRDGRFYREIRAEEGFEINDHTKQIIRAWIQNNT